MKKTSFVPLFVIGVCALVVLGGCGGDDSTTSQPVQRTTADITLKTELIGTLPDNTKITGYDVLIDLPEGVTVKSTIQPPETDPGVVVPTDSSSSVNAVYQPAAGGQPGRVHIIIVSPKANGFDPGTFCEVHANIQISGALFPWDFPTPTFEASFFDVVSQTTNTSLITGQVLQLTSTVVIQ